MITNGTNPLENEKKNQKKKKKKKKKKHDVDLPTELLDSARAIDEHDENILMDMNLASHIERLWMSEQLQQVYKRKHSFYFPGN